MRDGGSLPYVRTPTRPTPEPLRVNVVAIVAVGTIIWFLALVVLLVIGGHRDWVWVCLCGGGLGLIGIPLIRLQSRHPR